jgi:hypothetical protein
MHYYKTKIRLSGSVNNEIWKVVSAPELLLLQFIHGQDAVTDVKEIKNERIDLYAEKNRLKDLYNKSLLKREQTVDNIFGALAGLPERLPEEHLRKFSIRHEPLAIFDKNRVAKVGQDLKDQEQLDNLNGVKSSDEVNLADLME